MVCFTTPTYANRNLNNTTLRSTIGGYPIKYDGDCDGIASSAAYPFHNTIVAKLDRWATATNFYASTYGGLNLSWIGHLGTYRDFSGNPSWHYRARAWDISHLEWTNGTSLDICHGAHAAEALSIRRRYLASEALLRRHFRTVLNGYYNTAHETHFHIDNGCQMEPLNTSLRSHTLFMQLIANNFMFKDLVVDGVWGPATQDAFMEARSVMNMMCLHPRSILSNYITFLNYIARHGFANHSLGVYKYPGCT